MKRALFSIFSICLIVFATAACKGQEEVPATPILTVVSTGTATPYIEPTTQLPTQTATLTLTPTPAITNTPTLDSAAITLFLFDFVYTQSSLFEFDLHYTTGDYYGTGRLDDGRLLNYNCTFRENGSSRLACAGAEVPFDTKVFFQLFNREGDVLLYSNTFLNNVLTHGETLYTPTGVHCVVEPVLTGLTYDENTGSRCFIMTCHQNDQFLWGTLNSCSNPWPFQWDYYHPMHTPGT